MVVLQEEGVANQRRAPWRDSGKGVWLSCDYTGNQWHCPVVLPMSLGGGAGSPHVSIGSSCPRPQQWAATCPSLSPLPIDLPSQGGRKRQSLEGLTSAYCIYLVVLFSCKESRPSFLKQCCSPGGQGQGAGASALHTFPDSVGFPGLLRPGFPPLSISANLQPCKRNTLLRKS